MLGNDLAEVARAAQWAEEVGYSCALVAETNHDPFLPLTLVADATEHVQFGTSVAIAFSRSPMTMAQVAWDLNSYSRGRLLLGLGTQVQTHIERRFSMPWSSPTSRMREYVSALRAIWDSWQYETRLDFRGEFYTHTLMVPAVAPEPTPYGGPRIFLAALGPAMATVAAEVADGLTAHAFATERYLRRVIRPQLESALKLSGRTSEQFELSCGAFVVTGRTEEEMEAASVEVRKQIASYAAIGAVPGYRQVLQHHGWGRLQPTLNLLAKEGRWDEMGRFVDDEMLQAFAVVGEPSQLAGQLLNRFEGVADRLRCYTPQTTNRRWFDKTVAEGLARLRPAARESS